MAAPPAAPAKSAREAATRLELNMSREDVRRLLGAPDRTEGFRTGGRAVIVWYYLLESRQGRRTLTPLVFEGDRLSGWGENFYRLRFRELSGPQP
jgi:outer membrane protein assembly factor BamE (lipoprotein component of BamABCDE complex)